VVRGDQQFAEPGALLPIPLEVRVQALLDGREREGVKVRWEILEGGGATLGQATSTSDALGLASVRLTLGPEIGLYRVRASVPGMMSGPVDFEARAILTPELTLVPETPVLAGDTILLGGRNLSPRPDDNVVTFSQVRGRVVSASSTEIRVEVPRCLPERQVELRVRIGALSTQPNSLQVLEGDEFLSLASGEDWLASARDGLACFRLPSAPGARYLVVPHTAGTVGGGVYEVSLVGLTEQGEPKPVAPAHLRGTPVEHWEERDLQWEWDARIRRREAELLREMREKGIGTVQSQSAQVADPATIPQVGEVRQFNVLNRDNGFDKISAQVRYVSEHSIIYEDQEVPAGGFTTTDLLQFADHFDSPVYPTVTEWFGAESDLDGNQRVVILLTPAVNRLTQEGSESYVGGYFFGVDLLTNQTGSNKGEIFYAAVPDPTGIHGPVLARSTLLYSLPSILAHEFEHMVHFNQRILVAGADNQESLWLSEAMAQMAEDLVGAAFLARGDPAEAQRYQMGNWARARRFLLDPSQVSLLATLPPGTLSERGAGWLFLKYLHGQDSEGTLMRRIAGSTQTGVGTVSASMGRLWESLVSDWAGAMYLDGLPVQVRIGLKFPGFDLRYSLSVFDGEFPLQPPVMGRDSFAESGSLWSSAPDYYIITPPEAGGIALNVSGPEGRPPDAVSGLWVLVVRLD